MLLTHCTGFGCRFAIACAMCGDGLPPSVGRAHIAVSVHGNSMHQAMWDVGIALRFSHLFECRMNRSLHSTARGVISMTSQQIVWFVCFDDEDDQPIHTLEQPECDDVECPCHATRQQTLEILNMPLDTAEEMSA